jgi:two-component system, cell cycle sensor histidine kinase and response regulator CckA
MKPLRVLIVEDSEDDAELLLRELKRGGYDVTFERVFTAPAMTAVLEKGGWEIIISDHNMPGFTAMDALAILRSKNIDAPFIIVSGSITEEAAVRAMKAGANDFITKGRLARLLPAIERELKDAENRRRGRQAEEALRRGEDLYKLVVGVTQDTIYDADLKTNLVWFGGSFVSTFGYPQREEGWPFEWWRDQIHPDDVARVSADARRVLERGADNWAVEYRFRRADQSYATVYNRGNVIYDDQRRPLRWIGSLTDISDKKKLEEQLMQSQKMDAIGQLAGGIAHDFNNFISVILGYSDFVAAGLPAAGEAGDTLKSDVSEIKNAALRAAALTRQLLAFSRRQVLEPSVMDLNISVAGMEKLLFRLIGATVTLKTVLAPDLGRVKADPGQIEQVIMNLVVNACDAMPAGGTVTLETHNVTLGSRLPDSGVDVEPGSYILLTATDTGHGMDEQTKLHIFEPFFTTKEKGKGTGLGLSTVYGVVKQSGGYITVDSAPGKGTTFKIYLPRVEDPLKTAKEGAASAAPAAASATVLVVEDDDTIRKMVLRLLQSKGFQVLTAANGEAALALCKAREKGSIDLVVSDVVMPGISGIELVKRIEAMWPGMKTLLMSGYTDHAVFRSEVPELTGNFLMKPFTGEQLLKKIGERLG